MEIETRPWDAAELLETSGDIAAYLDAYLADGTPEELLRVANTIARSRGMTEFARRLNQTYIRAWREHRGLSLEKLAAAIGMDKGNLSRVERALLPYHQEMLEKIADALNCSASDLLMNDPKRPGEVLAAWQRATEAQRKQIAAIAEAIVRYSEREE